MLSTTEPQPIGYKMKFFVMTLLISLQFLSCLILSRVRSIQHSLCPQISWKGHPSFSHHSFAKIPWTTQQSFPFQSKLREGQANDALDGLWLALSRKSVLFRTDLQHKKTKKGKSRSWAEINEVSQTARHFAQLYRFTCQRLEQLSAPSATMKQYQPLEREHLNVMTMVIDLALRGTFNQSLAWFWTIDVQGDIRKMDGMAGCGWSIQQHDNAWVTIIWLIYKSTMFIGWRQKLREIDGRRKRGCCSGRWICHGIHGALSKYLEEVGNVF